MNKPRPRLALFGGTFDPVHEGHLAVAREAVEKGNLAQVIFLPCRQSPHKTEAAGASEQDRLAMLELATEGFAWAQVSDWEYRQPMPSYSWKTAEAFVRRSPEADLYWLMGADQWRVLETWSRADYLAELVRFIVHSRDGMGIREGEEALFLKGEHPASSSHIRELLGQGAPLPAGWLRGEVADFIARKGLYQE